MDAIEKMGTLSFYGLISFLFAVLVGCTLIGCKECYIPEPSEESGKKKEGFACNSNEVFKNEYYV
jgi:hypothetical protein